MSVVDGGGDSPAEERRQIEGRQAGARRGEPELEVVKRVVRLGVVAQTVVFRPAALVRRL